MSKEANKLRQVSYYLRWKVEQIDPEILVATTIEALAWCESEVGRCNGRQGETFKRITSRQAQQLTWPRSVVNQPEAA